MKIIWTRHAEERQKEWGRKLGVTLQEVEDLLLNPQQIVPGDRDALVAQTRRGKGLLRVPFIETSEGRQIVIEELPGVWAAADSLEDCRDELESLVEDWLLLGLRLGHNITSLGYIELNVPVKVGDSE